MLEVTIYASPEDDSPLVEEVDYVSLVSPETYGPPALVAPMRGDSRSSAPAPAARASVGQTVLYINTRLVPLWTIKRVSD